jgi:hypothetical protein
MTILIVALAFAAALAAWIIAVARRLRASDNEVRAFSTALELSEVRRASHLETLRSAAAGIDRTFEHWNTALEEQTEELRALSLRVSPVAGRERGRPISNGSQGIRPVKIVGGRVPESYAIASLKMTLEGRRRERNPALERSPKETLGLSWRHSVEFIVPTLGIATPKRSSARSAVAVEDMLASEGVAQALVRGWPEAQVHTRSIDPRGEWSGHAGNICTFCRDSRNPATGVVLSHPAVRDQIKLGFIELASEVDGEPSEAGIVIGAEGPLRSPSYAQERAVKDRHGNSGRAVLEDLALLARVSNPWDPQAKIFIVAGIRAFGTLGAAEFLRTRWDELYEATRERDFACLVSVRATYQVEIADEPSIGASEPDELATKAVELVPAEGVPTAVRIVRIEPAA